MIALDHHGMHRRYMIWLLENDPGTIYVFVTAYIPIGSMTVGPDTIIVLVVGANILVLTTLLVFCANAPCGCKLRLYRWDASELLAGGRMVEGRGPARGVSNRKLLLGTHVHY